MNTFRLIAAAAVFTLAGAVAHSADQAERNEATLARRLEGRTAGEPLSCIALMNSNRLEVIEGIGLVYDSGDTLYVARPSDPKALGRDDILVIDRFSAQLCNTDMVRTVNRQDGHFTGVVFLGKFVPYKKQG